MATICCARTSSGASRRQTASILGAAGGAHQRRALDQLVAGQREEPPLGRRVEGVARAADPLQPRRDGARRADEATEIDGADVDPELERGGGDHHLEVTGLQQTFGAVAALAGEAAVVGGDRVGAQPFAEVQRHPFDQPPGVHEHQRRFVATRQLGDPIVELHPLLVGGDRAQFVLPHLDPKIEIAPLTDVDHRGGWAPPPDQQPRGHVERSDRGRQPDPLKTRRRVREPFEGSLGRRLRGRSRALLGGARRGRVREPFEGSLGRRLRGRSRALLGGARRGRVREPFEGSLGRRSRGRSRALLGGARRGRVREPFEGSLGRRHQRLEALERQRQVGAALVGHDGVDLVDDDRPHVTQRAPA